MLPLRPWSRPHRAPTSAGSFWSVTPAAARESTARPSTAPPAHRSRGRSRGSCTSARPRSARTPHLVSPRWCSCPTATATSPTCRARPTSTRLATSARTRCCAARSWSSGPTTTSSTPSGRPATPSPRPGTTGATTPTGCAAHRTGSSRLTPAAQRDVGTTYTAAAAALFLADDQQVLPLLDGRKTRVASAGSARVLTHALGERRTSFLVPTSTTSLSRKGSVVARLCRTAEAEDLDRICVPDGAWGSTPHFLPLYYVPGRAEPASARGDLDQGDGARPRRPRRAAVVGQGTDPRPADRRTGRRREGDLRRASHRLRGPPGHAARHLPHRAPGRPQRLLGQDVGAGRTAVARQAALGSSRIDLSSVSRLELLPRSGRGQLWLLDAWGWRGGVSTAAPARGPAARRGHAHDGRGLVRPDRPAADHRHRAGHHRRSCVGVRRRPDLLRRTGGTPGGRPGRGQAAHRRHPGVRATTGTTPTSCSGRSR